MNSVIVKKQSKLVGDDWHLNSIEIKNEKEIKSFNFNNWIKKDAVEINAAEMVQNKQQSR